MGLVRTYFYTIVMLAFATTACTKKSNDYVIMLKNHERALHVNAAGKVTAADMSLAQFFTMESIGDIFSETFKIALFVKEVGRYLCFRRGKLVGLRRIWLDHFYSNSCLSASVSTFLPTLIFGRQPFGRFYLLVIAILRAIKEYIEFLPLLKTFYGTITYSDETTPSVSSDIITKRREATSMSLPKSKSRLNNIDYNNNGQFVETAAQGGILKIYSTWIVLADDNEAKNRAQQAYIAK
uniref:Lipoprotein n=1 Tax=Glossina palpalis gambiensis TaxID=67801 RepID=A0A1B0BTR1_9MUSC